MTDKIAPCLWFDGQAEAAATLYVGLFADSAIGALSRYGEGAPFPAGTALMVEFTLSGHRFQALNGGPQFSHSEAVSFSVDCTDQAEIDRLWDALIADGGSPGRCGWLKDGFGVSWQIVPARLGQLMSSGGAAGARTALAMMAMGKFDIAALEAAHAGADT